jgi:hypothetical protein
MIQDEEMNLERHHVDEEREHNEAEPSSHPMLGVYSLYNVELEHRERGKDLRQAF